MQINDEYFCGKCGEEVCNDDMVVQCEGKCEFWFHCSCVGTTEEEYEALSSTDISWICGAYQEGLQPFNSVDAVDIFHFDFMKNSQVDRWRAVLS